MSGVRTLALPGALLALGYLNWSLANFEIDKSPILWSAVAHAAGIAKPIDEAPLRSVADYPQSGQRPIFFANRRVPEKPKPKAKPPVVEVKEPLVNLEPLVLVGIKRQGKLQQVLVRSSSDAIGTWLSVGDQYRGWQLREVTIDNAILEGRGRRMEVRLYSPSQSVRQ